MTPSHWDLKMWPWDRTTPRFYPPGQHPANARERAYLEKLRDLRGQMERALRWRPMSDGPVSETPFPTPKHFRQIDEAIAYVEDKIAVFEQVESEAKAIAAARYDGL